MKNRFQAIKGDSAVQSGIHNLPTVLSVGECTHPYQSIYVISSRRHRRLNISAVVFAIASGLGVTVIGYYTPFMILGSTVMAIGAGLFLLFRVDSSISMWYVPFQ